MFNQSDHVTTLFRFLIFYVLCDTAKLLSAYIINMYPRRGLIQKTVKLEMVKFLQNFETQFATMQRLREN